MQKLIFLSLVLFQFAFSYPVAFRLDTFQDFYVSNCQLAVLDVFKANLTPVTIGIIGGTNRFGGDLTVVNAVRNAIATPGWDIEIANQGNQYEDFTTIPKDQQIPLINGSTSNLKSILSLTSINTFIPPFNTFNADLIDSLKALGFDHFSSSYSLDTVKPYPLSGQTFYRFPVSTFTADPVTNVPLSANVTLSQCQFADGFCVISVNPVDFCNRQNAGNVTNILNEVNSTQLQQLQNLISMARVGNTIVPIRRLNTDAPPYNTTLPDVPPSQVTIAFRLVGIQDFYQTNIDTAIMDVFQAQNVSLTIGIVASLFGQDSSLNVYLKQFAAPKEFAVYSYNNENFNTLPLADQIQVLNLSTKAIQTFLNVVPRTFIPTQGGVFNADTITAMKTNGFTILSSVPPYDNGDNSNPTVNLYRFPAYFNADFTSTTADAMLLNVKFQAQRNKIMVINLTPDFYANGANVDTTRTAALSTFLSNLKTAGYKFSTIINLPTAIPPPATTGMATTAMATTASATTSVASTVVTSVPASSTIASSAVQSSVASSSAAQSSSVLSSSSSASSAVETSQSSVINIENSSTSLVCIFSLVIGLIVLLL